MSAPGYRVPAEVHEALAAAGTPAWSRVIEQAVDRVLAEHGLGVENVRVVEEHEDDAFYAYTVTFRYPGALRAEERVRMGAVERTFWARVEAEASAQSVLLGDLRAGLALGFEDGIRPGKRRSRPKCRSALRWAGIGSRPGEDAP